MTISYQIFQLPKATQIDSSVRVVPGAKAYFYASTTSTPQDTYTDSALTTPSSNPVIADANGVFAPIYLDATKVYKLTLTTSADVLIYTVDPVNDQVLSTINVGAALWPRTALEISAGVHPATFGYEPFDPRRYSSVSDWADVYAQVNLLNESYDGWYRGDHAQHPAETNCIVGFTSYDDSQMSGTIGYRCTAFGVLTLSNNDQSVVGGGSNTAIGYASQQNSISTSGNTSTGTKTLASCTGLLSSHNGAFGNSTLEALVTGTQNNGFAYRCMYQLVTGDNNTGMGDVCLQGLLVGNGNTVVGGKSVFSKVAGDYTHGFGYEVLFSEQSAVITAITKAASAVVTISTAASINPFSVGQPISFVDVAGMTEINALVSVVTAIGGSSGAWTVTVNIDSSGFSTYTSGGYLCPHGNSAFGYRAGFNNFMRGGCTYFGSDVAQSAEPGYGNSFFGYQVGQIVNANGGGDGGELNTGMGFWSMRVMTTGARNSSFGNRSGEALTTGSDNTFIGSTSGAGNSTGSRNTAVGVGAGASNGANRQCFGYNAQASIDNQVNLGDTNITQIRAQVTTITAYSDERLKKNIQTLELPSGFIEELRAVSFQWDPDKYPDGVTDQMQVGFIAQELDALQNKYGVEWLGLVCKGDPERWSATPGKLLAPLIQYVQKQEARLKAIEAKLGL